MAQQLVLSSPEVDLIRQLLKNEQNKLLVEIRHTDSRLFRNGLKERLALVEVLSQRCATPIQNEPTEFVKEPGGSRIESSS